MIPVWSINRVIIRQSRRYLQQKPYFILQQRLQNTINISNRHINQVKLIKHNSFSKVFSTSSELVDPLKFEEVCKETLESLCDYFEEIIENTPHLKGADVVFGDGVLTVAFGEPYGTYVINRQSPNRQIWLSSPTSGPKRYDFVEKGEGHWIYKHDEVSLHQLLQEEINKIVKNTVDFSKCSHSLV